MNFFSVEEDKMVNLDTHINEKYFFSGYSTKQNWQDMSKKSLERKLELKQPVWQQQIVKELKT